jgi:hypothetical protein
MLARPLAALLALTTSSVASAEAPTETGAWKTFSSWSAGCDNTRSCTAAAGDLDRDSALALALTRSGEPAARPVIRLAFHHSVDGPYKGRATLSAGGRALVRLRIGIDTHEAEEGLEVTAEPARAAILTAMRREQTLEVRFDQAPGEEQRTLYRIPLDGAAAALLWMDERQKRIGTVTALVRPGSRPASVVPPTPAVPARPTAVALPQGSDPPQLSDAARERIEAMREEGCQEGIREMDEHEKPIVRRLTDERLLVSVRCLWGGSSTSESYFIVRDGAPPQVERARFPRPYERLDESDAERTPDFVLPDVYAGSFEKGELSSGDGTNGGSFCGERAEWVWTGSRFEAGKVVTLLPCGAAWVVVPLYRTR